MSADRVATSERIVAAFNAGLDEFMAYHAEDVVHVTAPDWPEGGTYRGKEAVRRLWTSILAEYREHSIDVDEVIPLDRCRVLLKTRWNVTGASSGATAVARVFVVFALEGEQITRVEYFLDEHEASVAAGLAE